MQLQPHWISQAYMRLYNHNLEVLLTNNVGPVSEQPNSLIRGEFFGGSLLQTDFQVNSVSNFALP